MDTLPVMPSMPSSQNPFSGGGGGSNQIMLALLGVLGLGAIGLGILCIVLFNQAQTATRTLETQKAAAATAAKAEQKKADDEANTIASQSPFRSYVAPVQYGSFEIKFPKNWSATVDHEPHSTQVSLILNPDFIRRTNGNDELVAAHITLEEKSSDSYVKTFADKVKRKILTQTEITVSGQKSFQFSGKFDNKKISRIVIVPVRDKVIVFANENDKYSHEFDQILAQATILP